MREMRPAAELITVLITVAQVPAAPESFSEVTDSIDERQNAIS
jgi:hypothetical protein